MITRYSVALNGVQLDALDAAIVITDIQYDPPSREILSSRNAGGDGARYRRTRTNSASVVVQFEIHEQDIQRRQDVCEAVQRWCLPGGHLTTGDRPCKRLAVICERPPVVDSALRWTGKLNITFTACSVPFWQDAWPVRIGVSAGAPASLYVPGNAANAMVDVSLTNKGASVITQADIAADETAFHFSGLQLAAGQTLEIGHDFDGLPYAKVGEASVLHLRTAASSDDLRMRPMRSGSVSAGTDGNASATFCVRGLYL